MKKTQVVLSEQVAKMVKGFDESLKADKFLIIQAIVSEVIAEAESVEILDFLQTEADRVEKRNSKKSTKPSKTAVAKLEDIAKIEAFFIGLEDKETFLHGKEISEAIEGFQDYTPQKITSRLSEMVKQETLIKGKATSDKKKTGYKLA